MTHEVIVKNENANLGLRDMLFCILQICPSVIRELSRIICRVLIFDTQISAMKKTLNQGGALTHSFLMHTFSSP